MTQRQAALTSVGEYVQRREAYDKQQQSEWERNRWMVWNTISPFMGKNRPRTPEQWVRFPWEKKAHKSMTIIEESQIQTLNDIYNDFIKRKG